MDIPKEAIINNEESLPPSYTSDIYTITDELLNNTFGLIHENIIILEDTFKLCGIEDETEELIQQIQGEPLLYIEHKRPVVSTLANIIINYNNIKEQYDNERVIISTANLKIYVDKQIEKINTYYLEKLLIEKNKNDDNISIHLSKTLIRDLSKYMCHLFIKEYIPLITQDDLISSENGIYIFEDINHDGCRFTTLRSSYKHCSKYKLLYEYYLNMNNGCNTRGVVIKEAAKIFPQIAKDVCNNLEQYNKIIDKFYKEFEPIIINKRFINYSIIQFKLLIQNPEIIEHIFNVNFSDNLNNQILKSWMLLTEYKKNEFEENTLDELINFK